MDNAHGLQFDLNHVEMALQFLETGDETALQSLIDSPATGHLLGHARHFNSGMPAGSAAELTRALIEPAVKRGDLVETARQAMIDAGKLIREPDSWLRHTLELLPGPFRFTGTLFLTFGYDIGVSFGPNASINLAHPCFRKTREELVVYCVHELHHAGFSAYQPGPDFNRIKTCGDLSAIVDYCTHLEGMAVLAGLGPRQDRNIDVDYMGDYAALADPNRMAGLINRFFELRRGLATRADELCTEADLALIEEMSSGERLWYRVGCHMGQTIAAQFGKERLIMLIEKGPRAFFEAYAAVG